MTNDNTPNSPELEAIQKEIERLVETSLERALEKDELHRWKTLIEMRSHLVDKPTTVYVEKYDNVYDETINKLLKQKLAKKPARWGGQRKKITKKKAVKKVRKKPGPKPKKKS